MENRGLEGSRYEVLAVVGLFTKLVPDFEPVFLSCPIQGAYYGFLDVDRTRSVL